MYSLTHSTQFAGRPQAAQHLTPGQVGNSQGVWLQLRNVYSVSRDGLCDNQSQLDLSGVNALMSFNSNEDWLSHNPSRETEYTSHNCSHTLNTALCTERLVQSYRDSHGAALLVILCTS